MIFRREAGQVRVLMGRRVKGHDFMPGAWVFPGGRLERPDFHTPAASNLSHETAAVMARYMPLSRARALGLAAIRETFEEAGLHLTAGDRALPDLAALEVVGRAITPPIRGKRFDTWFFMADASALASLERGPDCGELEEIAWIDVRQAGEIGLQGVTNFILDSALERLEDRSRALPFLRFRHRVRVVEAL